MNKGNNPYKAENHEETKQILFNKIYHKNGSMFISTAEHGNVRSKLVITSGWITPKVPITWLFGPITAAHRPGKKVWSE